MSLKGRSALITGATGELGKVFSDTLAELGADLILVDRPGTELDKLCIELKNRWGIESNYLQCDLLLTDQRDELIKRINRDFIQLNILVNNAAFVGSSELKGWAVPFENQSIESWGSAIELNLTAVFDLCKGITPKLKISNGSSIINIASIYGLYGPDWRLYEDTNMSNPAAYGVSKGGLIQLTRWLSTTVAPNIRVNSISPGGIIRNQPKHFIERYESRTPLKRMAVEDDFRGALAYLATDLSGYVTGQNIIVDGGWGVW